MVSYTVCEFFAENRDCRGRLRFKKAHEGERKRESILLSRTLKESKFRGRTSGTL